jgi:hypothetical protein
MRFYSYLSRAIQKLYEMARHTDYYGIYENIRNRRLHLIACDSLNKQLCVQESSSREHLQPISHSSVHTGNPPEP